MLQKDCTMLKLCTRLKQLKLIINFFFLVAKKLNWNQKPQSMKNNHTLDRELDFTDKEVKVTDTEVKVIDSGWGHWHRGQSYWHRGQGHW